MLAWCLTLIKVPMNVNFTQICGPIDLTCLGVCLTHIKMTMNVNFTQICGPRDLTCLEIYLILEQMSYMNHTAF